MWHPAFPVRLDREAGCFVQIGFLADKDRWTLVSAKSATSYQKVTKIFLWLTRAYAKTVEIGRLGELQALFSWCQALVRMVAGACPGDGERLPPPWRAFAQVLISSSLGLGPLFPRDKIDISCIYMQKSLFLFSSFLAEGAKTGRKRKGNFQKERESDPVLSIKMKELREVSFVFAITLLLVGSSWRANDLFSVTLYILLTFLRASFRSVRTLGGKKRFSGKSIDTLSFY